MASLKACMQYAKGAYMQQAQGPARSKPKFSHATGPSAFMHQAQIPACNRPKDMNPTGLRSVMWQSQGPGLQ